MADLSSAAQAILKAAYKATRNPKWQTNFYTSYAAAVLRAAAERTARVVPPRQSVTNGTFWREGYVEGVIFFRDELLAIAAELEAQ